MRFIIMPMIILVVILMAQYVYAADQASGYIEETSDGWKARITIVKGNYIVTCRSRELLENENAAKQFLKTILNRIDINSAITNKALIIIRLESTSL